MGGRRTGGLAGIAAAAFLCAAAAKADERSVAIPVFSAGDGGKVWVEISSSGDREKAVPYLEVPRDTVRRVEEAGDAGNVFLAPAPGRGRAALRGKLDIREFFDRHRPILVEERPEGVSFGRALDLAGEIRDALKKKGTGKERWKAVLEALRQPPGDGESPAEAGDRRERPVSHPSAGTSPASPCVNYCLESR